ncbi:MAG: Holliday junction resolvase-like protein [Candidatus Woesearchaeota archaeon]
MITLVLSILLAVVGFLAVFFAVLLIKDRSMMRRRTDAVHRELVRSLDSFEDELTEALAHHTVPRRIMEHLRTSLASQSEQFAAFHSGFSYDPKDARFLGSPIDFIVFKGRVDGVVDEVVFVEVKQHRGVRLTRAEESLRETVSSGNVRWERIDLSEHAGVTTGHVRTMGAEDLETDVERSVREKTRRAREQLIERLSKHL